MDDPYDSYPEDSNRRRFVKGVVGAGALTGVIGAGAATIDITTGPTGAGGGQIEFVGSDLIGGPAPHGMPQVPVRMDEEGFLYGIWPEVEFVEQGGQEIAEARTPLGPVTYDTAWFQYCGSQNHPSIDPAQDLDNALRYRDSSTYEWQANEVSPGDQVHIDDFQDYDEWGNAVGDSGIGKPAEVTWRSEDLEDESPLPVTLIRSPLIVEEADYEPDGQVPMEERTSEDNDLDWVTASTAAGFVAIHNQCSHFCCVPSYKNPNIAEAAAYGAEDLIYCQCHQSIYDPFTLARQSMIARPRSE